MATTVEIRCYCHGLGDSMLLRFAKEDGKPFWMLIDCGIHSAAKGGAQKMREVVADIAARTGGVIDVVVGTHEHWDHLSAFLQANEQFARITVREVWFSWAENPSDPDARKLDRFKADAAFTLAEASGAVSDSVGMAGVREGIDAILGFVFGAKGERVRDAREKLRGMGSVVRYLEPGTMAPLPDVPKVRAYVFGPPRDPKLLGIEDILSETYAIGGGALPAAPLANAFDLRDGDLSIDDDPSAPFDGMVGRPLSSVLAGDWSTDPNHAADDAFIWTHYLDPGAGNWRRVDNDWLASSVDLALQLDGRTNNSSLVLAFELIDSGRVLLFAADAQIGNWLSWSAVTFEEPGKAPVKADDLVRRTVFYKVGHHGSRNATRAAALEMMDRSNLVAFSPTDESLAGRVGWKDFPAPKTTARLHQLTSGRFIQSDARWVHDATVPSPVKLGGALKDIVVQHGKYVDLTIG
jgi:hypothetical protein